jgi:glucose-1-phosphate thymidylyltransferase
VRKNAKGIILAGGSGTRLFPITRGVCKQLLPIYDKPMIYYPLSVLMLSGITDILIISTPKDLPRFEDIFGNGRQLGLNFSYKAQKEPKGIAEAFILGENFIGKSHVSLLLGDNIFYGDRLPQLLKKAIRTKKGATIFGYYVKDPQRYGVIEFDKNYKVLSIEEKPQKPKSNWVATGLYFYDERVVKIAKSLKPSWRGELEITDLNNEYLKRDELNVQLMGRGHAWLDTGTYESLIDAAMFIRTIEARQGLKIGCVEEIAYRMGYISGEQLGKLAEAIPTSYGDYLRDTLRKEKSFNG